jgi:small subunit ribosomal protein S17
MRTLIGIIVSDRMQKTRVVAVERTVPHARYERHLSLTQRFKAHDEKEEYHTGDWVLIRETRPRSKDKRWEIVKKVSPTLSSVPAPAISEGVDDPTPDTTLL